MNEEKNPTRQHVVDLASDYIGLKEGTAEHKKLVDVYNKEQSTYKMSYSSAWCAMFVSHIMILSGGNKQSSSFPNAINCEDMIKKLKIKGRYINKTSSKFIPQYGDLIFYDWESDNHADHVGIVSFVEDGTTPKIKVIEGNYSDQVKVRELSYDDKRIKGYGLPRYK